MRLSLHILAVNLNLLTVSNCCGAQRNLCSYPAICILFVAARATKTYQHWPASSQQPLGPGKQVITASAGHEDHGDTTIDDKSRFRFVTNKLLSIRQRSMNIEWAGG